MLIVIDEAHNVCPQEAEDPLTAIATEHAVRIAGEGRKFGLYLLVSTQRPQKVHENVLSQCDNLLLMRMNSTADLGFVGDVFSFVPRSLLERATTFQPGRVARGRQDLAAPGAHPLRRARQRGGRRRRARRLGGLALERFAALGLADARDRVLVRGGEAELDAQELPPGIPDPFEGRVQFVERLVEHLESLDVRQIVAVAGCERLQVPLRVGEKLGQR